MPPPEFGNSINNFGRHAEVHLLCHLFPWSVGLIKRIHLKFVFPSRYFPFSFSLSSAHSILTQTSLRHDLSINPPPTPHLFTTSPIQYPRVLNLTSLRLPPPLPTAVSQVHLMAFVDGPDTAQLATEGDGQDSSEPPNRDGNLSNANPRSRNSSHRDDPITPATPAPSHQKSYEAHPPVNGVVHHTQRRPSMPSSSPHPRESGNGHKDLAHLVVGAQPIIQAQVSRSTTTSTSPSPTSSPSQSESNLWSAPPTRPPSRPQSQAPSRAASMSGAKPDLSSLFSLTKSKKDKPPVTPIEQSPEPRPRASSVHSADGGTRFNLRDLLGPAPKLSRKSSARSSASSRKSDSEGGPKSTAGESTGSLSKKYGTCERVAIGKGATSVVRLAHKWDRTEEKLYAVKVIYILIHSDP
jgi:protein-serine/threonine kinase